MTKVNQKLRGNIVIDGAIIDNGESVTPNTAAGVSLETRVRPMRMALLTLTSVPVSIAAAQDFGSVKLLDFPANSIMIMGVNVNLVASPDAVVTDVTTIDYAIGTAALASTDFSNAGEDNLVAENDVAAQGVMNVRSTAALSLPLVFDAGNNDIYLNVQAAVASGTGVPTFSGTVEVFYIDLGS